MFRNSQTQTRVVDFKNRTIVISRVENKKNQFRIYIDSVYNGILSFEKGEWSLTTGFQLPMGVFTLLIKRMGIGKDIIDSDEFY
ncbi:hypothetical protein [Pedobacter aquatilis]|uniref:hypothetical protein n=1 Tax=Pedobacter aquatilis TaxID=351343 RepID=UPI0029314D60|nr:hypothetical protein [Pedobacter aquatilis]